MLPEELKELIKSKMPSWLKLIYDDEDMGGMPTLVYVPKTPYYWADSINPLLTILSRLNPILRKVGYQGADKHLGNSPTGYFLWQVGKSADLPFQVILSVGACPNPEGEEGPYVVTIRLLDNY